MALGPGGNTAVQVGKDGVLVVDSQYARSAERLIAQIKKLSSKPIRYVLNTSVDEAHTGGNEALSKAGSTITGGNVAAANAGWPAAILAQENVLERMSAPPSGAGGGSAATPSGGWPMDIYREDHKDLYFNGEAVQLLHQPAAHTDGDSIVFFRKSDVIATGDVFTPASYPMIDIARGGSINGIVDALNRIIDLTVPAEKQEGGTMVIPGHGRLCDEADVVEYRDMMTIIRDRIRDLVKKGMTLEQVKAMRPTRDYDPLYGATEGPWTTDSFVEAAYNSLKQYGKSGDRSQEK
jgi:glyoxylase-like metal-dependent hydrolase (beta-lactamase superfamily II)